MPFDNVIHLDSLEMTTEHRDGYGGRWAQISSKLGSYRLGFNVAILDPGNFGCPYHFHVDEEELFYVLDGHATLRQNDEFRHVGPGDLIFTPLGPKYAHQLYNHTDAPFRYLSISNLSQWDVCEYTDSGKVNVRGQARVFKIDSSVDYWVDEENPRAAWPDEVLRGKLPTS